MVRHKNRFLVLEINEIGKKIESPLKMKEQLLYNSVMKEIGRLYGDFGLAAVRAGFVTKYINEHTRVAVMRCRRGPHKLVSSSIPFIKQVADRNVIINILYMGASIKQCFSFLKNYQQRKFNEYCLTLKTEKEKNELRNAMLNLDSILAKL